MKIRAAPSSANFTKTGPEHIVMAASSDHIEATEPSQHIPHLLEVLKVLQDASGMQKGLQELYQSYYRDIDLPSVHPLLPLLWNVFHGFIDYVEKGTRFLSGRVYCTDCGAVLLNHYDEQNLVAEALVRPLSDGSEMYSAQSFAGQVDFENHLRAGFRELQRVAHDSSNMITDICSPEVAGFLPLNRRRTGSDTLVSSPCSKRQRAQRTNPSHHVENHADDEEIEAAIGTSTDSRDVRGEICEKCKVARDLAIGAGSSGEGSGMDNDDAEVYLIIDI